MRRARLERCLTLVVLVAAAVAVAPGVAAGQVDDLEVSGVQLRGSTLVGQVTCSTTPRTLSYLDGWVVQDRSGPAITLYGELSGDLACGSSPTPFAIPLTRGNGVLTGGPATWRVENETGLLQVRGRVEVPPPTAPTAGPLRITLGRHSSAPATVSGTVHRDAPTEVDVGVFGVQRAGRHLIEAEGAQAIRCHGTTPFAVPLSTSRFPPPARIPLSPSGPARLAGGPIDVVVTAHAGSLDPSTTSGQVILRGGQSPESTSPPPPDPRSGIEFGTPVLGPDRLLVVPLTYTGCPVGAAFITGWRADSRDGWGQRVGHPLERPFADYGYCEQTPFRSAVSISLPPDGEIRRLALTVTIEWWMPPDDQQRQRATNTVEIRL